MPKAILTDDMRRFIVCNLAKFDTPQQVVDAVKEEYDVDITRQSVQHYDCAVGTRPAKKWRKLFEFTREEFLKNTSAIPIAQQSFRLKERLRLYRKVAAGPRPNAALANELLDAAARDFGGMFTNRRELTGAGGARLIPDAKPANYDLSKLSIDELLELERLTDLATKPPVTE